MGRVGCFFNDSPSSLSVCSLPFTQRHLIKAGAVIGPPVPSSRTNTCPAVWQLILPSQNAPPPPPPPRISSCLITKGNNCVSACTTTRRESARRNGKRLKSSDYEEREVVRESRTRATVHADVSIISAYYRARAFKKPVSCVSETQGRRLSGFVCIFRLLRRSSLSHTHGVTRDTLAQCVSTASCRDLERDIQIRVPIIALSRTQTGELINLDVRVFLLCVAAVHVHNPIRYIYMCVTQ